MLLTVLDPSFRGEYHGILMAHAFLLVLLRKARPSQKNAPPHPRFPTQVICRLQIDCGK